MTIDYWLNRTPTQYRYIPSDGVVMSLDVSEINGNIQDHVSGTIEDFNSGKLSCNIQDVSIDKDLTGIVQ